MAIPLNPFRGSYNAIILIRIQSFARASRYVLRLIVFLYNFVASHVHPFWIQLFYFIIIDLFGSLLLMVLKPADPDLKPRYVDMFFLSTSALTVSGLSTVEMERLSSSQIVVTGLLMLVGGEVFVSMLSVFCRTGKQSVAELTVNQVNSADTELESLDSVSTIERIESGTDISFKDLRKSCLKSLGSVILVYWVFFHVTGFVACLVYITIIPSAREVLKGKGINLALFAFYATVSSFANGGLIPTNENMAIFAKNSVFDGLNWYQKVVSALFMSVNARHAGENSVDCSLISPAVLLFIIFMMYLPSSATFMPVKEDEEKKHIGEKDNAKGRSRITSAASMLILPQVVCIIIFVIVACILERRRLLIDPLNFSTLNVIFEVISAYGNVGLSTGYACSRLQKLHPEMICTDKPYSFSGWWSDEGKLLLAFVMLYGRLKKFSERNGKAWTLKG
ncbi:Cation transporter HKT1 [Rhynchospora pubera]|uniref:Cation transporter HKT1 n=1 Tax=Rhynchospora pubera TaxID=906938 RepID=A0AAV8DAU1_9POAL|nr:Cation transporter HKT1 [Rhynchospora pubera]